TTIPPAPVVFDEIGLSIGKLFISFMPVEGATSYEADVFQSDCADTSLDIGFLTSFAWTSGQVAAETLSLTPVLQNNGWVVPPGSCYVLTLIVALHQTSYVI